MAATVTHQHKGEFRKIQAVATGNGNYDLGSDWGFILGARIEINDGTYTATTAKVTVTNPEGFDLLGQDGTPVARTASVSFDSSDLNFGPAIGTLTLNVTEISNASHTLRVTIWVREA